jgi:hypothetical protein
MGLAGSAFAVVVEKGPCAGGRLFELMIGTGGTIVLVVDGTVVVW